MIYADEYYHIGSVHRAKGSPCQDHALSYVDEKMAFGSISDGCSQGENTDVGARVINYATLQALKNCALDKNSNVIQIVECVQSERLKILERVQQMLGLKNADLLATNLCASIFAQKAFVHVAGDGVVAVVDIEGNMEVRRFLWEDNAPHYPFYDLRQQDQFVAFHGNDLLASRLREERWCIGENGSKKFLSSNSYSLIRGMQGITLDLSADWQNGTLAFISVFSDGVEQVDNIEWLEAVRECLAYKNTNGLFVKRRMMRFIKESAKIYKGPLDDISCATLYVPKNFEPRRE